MDLVEFLLAQLDEDEWVARTAGGPHMMWRDWYTQPWYDGTGERADVWSLGCGLTAPGSVEKAQSEHMTRHDPGRVLREVEAKRRIVDEYQQTLLASQKNTVEKVEADRHGGDERLINLQIQFYGRLVALETVIRHHAAVFSDHKDYRQEWKP